MAKPELNDRQKLFVQHYVADQNATQAAIRAGYSEKSAEVTGHRLLRNAKIARFIEKAQGEQVKRIQFDSDDVLRELGRIGFSNMLDYMRVDENGVPRLDFSNITRDQAAAISELNIEDDIIRDKEGNEIGLRRKTKFKLYNKQPALNDLAKHFNLFKEDNNKTMTLEMQMKVQKLVEQAKQLTPEERNARITELRSLLEDGQAE